MSRCLLSELSNCHSHPVAERLDDLRGLRLKDPLRPTWPVWINLFFICFGLFVIVTQTLALLAGKPGDSYDFLFG